MKQTVNVNFDLVYEEGSFMAGLLALLGAGSPPSTGPTTLISDTFTDTVLTNLTAHTIAPTNTPATSWGNATGTWLVNASNQVTNTVGSSHEFITVDAGQADVTVTLAATTPASGSPYPGMVLRWQDANNYWLFRGNKPAALCELYENVAGTFTLRASTSKTFAFATTYALKAVLSGSTITCTVDGGSSITYASATSFQTKTKHGLYNFDTASSNIYDNFLVTNP